MWSIQYKYYKKVYYTFKKKKYQNQLKEGNLNLFCFGKKTSEYFTKRDYPVVESNIAIFDDLSFKNTSIFAEKLMQDFASKKYDKIEGKGQLSLLKAELLKRLVFTKNQ